MSRLKFCLLIAKQVLSRNSQSVRKGGLMYIVGIGIAKRFHEAAIIDSNGKVIVKRIRFANSNSGFLKLMDAVRKLDAPIRHGSNRALLVARLCQRFCVNSKPPKNANF